MFPSRPDHRGLLAVSLAIGAVAGVAIALSEAAFDAPVALRTVVLAVALVGIVGYCAFSWKRLDEAAREAHKWAWWWGSTGGLVVAGLFLPAMMQGSDLGLHRWVGSRPGDLAVGGAFAVLTLQVAGYFAAWATWWLRKR